MEQLLWKMLFLGLLYMASRAMKLRWHLRSFVNERICYKSYAVTYCSLATGSIDFHPENQRKVSPELGIL